jgi:hypothetical protein
MIISDPKLFERAAQELLQHVSHKLGIMPIGGDAAPESVIVECEQCHAALIEFLPQVHNERPDPERVKYEGRYEQGLDLCYVEVSKPGKSPYPMQERQDLINHSPTGIAWGYGGSGPAQCSFAILMDYLGDEQRARALYQDFKFTNIAKLGPNQPWTLTGGQIEQAIRRIEAPRKFSPNEPR